MERIGETREDAWVRSGLPGAGVRGPRGLRAGRVPLQRRLGGPLVLAAAAPLPAPLLGTRLQRGGRERRVRVRARLDGGPVRDRGVCRGVWRARRLRGPAPAAARRAGGARLPPRGCPPACGVHGTCRHGACTCDEDWSGDTCTIASLPDAKTGGCPARCATTAAAWRCGAPPRAGAATAPPAGAETPATSPRRRRAGTAGTNDGDDVVDDVDDDV
ncbi:uncharacterized protein LOC144950926 [Lampetra fluviatilis]